MVEEYRLFAENVQFYMNKYGYTQLDLAEKCNVSNTSVSRWVHGEKFPRIRTLEKLCELFHCTKADLLQIKQYSLTDEHKMLLQRLEIYAQNLNEKGISKVIDFICDLKDEYFESKTGIDV